MSYLIIREKTESLSENLSKGLRYLGQAMSCVEDMQRSIEDESERMGERRYIGDYRNGYRFGNRHSGDWRDEREVMGERRYRY